MKETYLLGDISINSQAKTLYQRLEENFKLHYWNSITICSAYFTKGAAEKLIELFNLIKKRKRIKINIVIGAKDYFTQPEAVNILLKFLENQSKEDIEYHFVQPSDRSFHIKSYLFLGPTNKKMIIGSANMTMNGLQSFGELLVEINDNEIINQVAEHIDCYYDNSVSWKAAITDYTAEYKKNAPILHKEAYRKYADNIGKKLIKLNKKGIQFASPTIGVLESLESDKNQKIGKIIAEIQSKNPTLAKYNWILFQESSYNDITSKYRINSLFDRPENTGDSWEIGSKRMVGKVGEILSIDGEGVVLIMRKRSIHYQVTKSIFCLAKKLLIITDDDEKAPSKVNLEKYVDFILKNKQRKNNV